MFLLTLLFILSQSLQTNTNFNQKLTELCSEIETLFSKIKRDEFNYNETLQIQSLANFTAMETSISAE